MADSRFDGVEGSEYDLFPLSMPGGQAGCDRLQQEIVDGLMAQLQVVFPGRSEFRVLEGGCGSGFTTETLVTHQGLVVVAVDGSGVMLQQARDRISDSRVTFVKADMLEFLVGQPDESFDAFVSGFMLHNCPSEYRRAVIVELGRVLRSGGVFVNGDKLAEAEPQHTATLAARFEHFQVYDQIGRPDVRQEWERHYREDDAIRFSEEEQALCLAEAGFGNVQLVYRVSLYAVVTARKA